MKRIKTFCKKNQKLIETSAIVGVVGGLSFALGVRISIKGSIIHSLSAIIDPKTGEKLLIAITQNGAWSTFDHEPSFDVK